MTLYRSMFGRVHPVGRPFVLGSLGGTAILFLLYQPLGWVGLLASLFVIYFFRDPERVVPQVPGALVSPADGLVAQVAEVTPPDELGLGSGRRCRISIFLSVVHVHVNRVPADGRIGHCRYVPGAFVNASLEKASEENERQSIVMTTDDGATIAFVQIAGLIARRIVCDLSKGQRVTVGQRFGIIRFGSRVDLYLDKGMAPMVVEGQTVVGGETIIADGRFGEPAREGQAR